MNPKRSKFSEPMIKMRLNLYIAKCGRASRRGADELIRNGRISINGKIVNNPGIQVEVNRDKILLDDNLLSLAVEKKYVLLNKPSGVLTTVSDPFGRPTVLELVPQIPGLVPVGRLDLDTEGVLLLTNDGDLNFRLAHPRYKIDKTYFVKVDLPIVPKLLSQLHKGVDIGEKNIVRAGVVKQIDMFNLTLVLHEGRKRQIKRMLRVLGFQVKYLCREQFASLRVDNLEPSSWRFLNQREILKLKKLVGLSDAD